MDVAQPVYIRELIHPMFELNLRVVINAFSSKSSIRQLYV